MESHSEYQRAKAIGKDAHTREVIDHMAKRIHERDKVITGKDDTSYDDAHRRAVEVAERSDRKQV